MCFYIVTYINGRGTIMSIPRTTSQFHGCDSILNPMRPYKVTNDRKMDNPGNKTQDGDKHNNNKQTKTSTTQKTKKMSNTGPHQKPVFTGPQFLMGVRCCSLLFASTCVHLRFLMGSGVAHYSSRAPVFTPVFDGVQVLLITLREHLCSPPKL